MPITRRSLLTIVLSLVALCPACSSRHEQTTTQPATNPVDHLSVLHFPPDQDQVVLPLRPFFRAAAEHLRKYPPTGIKKQEDLDSLIESVEAPWGVRIERVIKEVFDPDAEDPHAASAALANKIGELGLQPFIQPEPLPVIEKDEISLICWMAVDSNIRPE